MSAFHQLTITPPILNSACPWASSYEDLKALHACPNTGAVTTRTATWRGFPDHPQLHQVAFATESLSSVNSYGYSPYPLVQYIEWVRIILKDNPDSNKPIIISITAPIKAATPDRSLDISSQEEEMIDMDMPSGSGTGSTDDLPQMISIIQKLREELRDMTSAAPRIAIEINTSCPNITGHPPPAYEPDSLRPVLKAISDVFFKDQTLAVGLKLPPYVYAQQFVDIVDFIASFSKVVDGVSKNPIAFLTCTNTLGTCLMFDSQAAQGDGRDKSKVDSPFTLPSVWGGLAGESIHALSLGNVYAFSKLLTSHPDDALKSIAIIGVGGVISSAAAERMMQAGASAVACATALGKNGLGIFEELAKAPTFANAKTISPTPSS